MTVEQTNQLGNGHGGCCMYAVGDMMIGLVAQKHICEGDVIHVLLFGNSHNMENYVIIESVLVRISIIRMFKIHSTALNYQINVLYYTTNLELFRFKTKLYLQF